MAANLIKAIVDSGKKAAFVANRIGLVHQFSEHLNNVGVSHGIIQGQNTFGANLDCVVCSVQTVARRGLPPVDFVIIDECHATANSNDYKKLIDEKIDKIFLSDENVVIGFISSVVRGIPLLLAVTLE